MARLLANQNDLLLVNTARYYGDSPVVVDNDYNQISLSPEFINTVNGKLDASATTNWDVTPYTGGTNISITDHTISGKDWSNDIDSATSGKLDTSTFDTYVTAHANDDVTPYTGGTGISVSNHQISCTGDITPYTGGTGISVSNHQISCTGDITAYTAGSNISISNHVVSSKDWSSDISSTVNTALANYQPKLTSITDIQVVTALPQSPVANVLYLVKE